MTSLPGLHCGRQGASHPLSTTCRWNRSRPVRSSRLRAAVSASSRAGRYFDIAAGGIVASPAGWTYLEPARGFEVLGTCVALYPGRMESCEVDGGMVSSLP